MPKVKGQKSIPAQEFLGAMIAESLEESPSIEAVAARLGVEPLSVTSRANAMRKAGWNVPKFPSNKVGGKTLKSQADEQNKLIEKLLADAKAAKEAETPTDSVAVESGETVTA